VNSPKRLTEGLLFDFDYEWRRANHFRHLTDRIQPDVAKGPRPQHYLGNAIKPFRTLALQSVDSVLRLLNDAFRHRHPYHIVQQFDEQCHPDQMKLVFIKKDFASMVQRWCQHSFTK